MTRTIEVERPNVPRVKAHASSEPRSAEDWATLLETFATRLAQGRVYRRDLPTLAPAVRHLVEV